MAGGNISPRQKMINMMYLVLTALLALNVSAEILKAFHLVEVSLEKSSVNVDTKNTQVMKGIDKYHKDFPDDPNGTMVFNNASKARQVAGDLITYIEGLKTEIVAGAEGRKEDTNGDGRTEDEEIQKADDTEKHANLMINNKKGEELRAKINKARQDLIALVPKDKQATIKSDLITDDFKEEGELKKWESVMFEHTPAAAVVTLLTKIQNDTRNTEAQVLDMLKGMLTEDIVVVENFTAKVIPNNGTYITQGGKYSADIFLAASTRQEANITVNGSALKVEGGIGKYELVASGEGEKKYKGVITTKRSNGKVETYDFEGSYFVLKPLAVISATKMNVVYIGLENPIAVSVPGYSANDVQVSVSSGATLTPDKEKGTYLLKVTGTAREVIVSASVKDKMTNAVKKMGEQKYRVRAVPEPLPQLGSIKASGPQPAGVVKSAQFVLAILENFPYEGIKYTPVSFQLGYFPKVGAFKGMNGAGQALTAEMKATLSRAQPGDRIILANMKAQGPGGLRVLPSALVIDIK
jgi:gliding motility-associated protein GldM